MVALRAVGIFCGGAALFLAGCLSHTPPTTPPTPPPDCTTQALSLPEGVLREATTQARLALTASTAPGGLAQPCCTTSGGCSADTTGRWAAWAATTIAVSGRVFDELGNPIAGASISVGGVATTTADDGAFALANLPRANELLTVEAEGYAPFLTGLNLAAGQGVPERRLPPILLTPRRNGVARLLFTGDMMLARRFMDPNGTTPVGELPPPDPDAWVNSASPGPGARRVVSFIEPVFRTVDFPVVNLETTVTDDPSTPDLTKAYIFFTLPGALAALDELGVSYVSVANNHLCDYFDAGLEATLANLDTWGLHHSGAGADETAAFAPYRLTVGGLPLAFLSMSSAGPGAAVSCAATSTTAGVADLTNEVQTHAVVSREKGLGNTVVAQLHAGEEYNYAPSTTTHALMEGAAAAGAALVVGHHPHVREGLWRAGGVLIAPSLGNFVFDQDRQDTVLTFLLVADLGAHTTLAAEIVPIFVDAYAPKVVAGELAARMTRTLAEASDRTTLTLAADLGRGRLGWGADAAVPADRTTTLTVHVPAAGFTVLDLRGIAAPEESLASARTAQGTLSAHVGRDLLSFGGFEDVDVDPDLLEGPRWEVDAPARICAVPYRGAASLCLSSDDLLPTVTDVARSARTRLTFFPQTTGAYTLYGFLRSECGGEVDARVNYYREDESLNTSETLPLTMSGSSDWYPFARDLDPPVGVGEADWARVLLAYGEPTGSGGRVAVDEVALISWEESGNLGAGMTLATPHARDFLRIEGAQGDYALTLTFRAERRAVADAIMNCRQ